MVEYHVTLRRHRGSSRPDVCIFSDADREKALLEMQKYVKKNGFTIYDRDGRFTVDDVTLVAKEPIVGSPVISETPYCELFTIYDERKKEPDEK